MPEDENTGEVFESDAEQEVLSMLTPTGAKMNPMQLATYQPTTPERMEEYIMVMGDRLEQFPSIITGLYTNVHEATVTFEEAFSDAVLNGPHAQISFARQYAVQQTLAQKRALNHAKEKLRFAEEVQKTLSTRFMGMLNINKAVSAQFMGTMRR